MKLIQVLPPNKRPLVRYYPKSTTEMLRSPQAFATYFENFISTALQESVDYELTKASKSDAFTSKYCTLGAVVNNKRSTICNWQIPDFYGHTVSAEIRKLARRANEKWRTGSLPDFLSSAPAKEGELIVDECSSSLSDFERRIVSKIRVVTPQSKVNDVDPSGHGKERYSCFNMNLSDIIRDTDNNSMSCSFNGVQAVKDRQNSSNLSAEISSDNDLDGKGSTKPLRLMCMTYTISPYHAAVREIISTWGKRCDGYLAMSNHTDSQLSAVHIVPGRPEWREYYHEMWAKSQAIWQLVATTLLEEYDYFLIGGDDLYVIVENLRDYLSSDKIQELSGGGAVPLYIGRPLNQNSYLEYNSGGAGYVLNAAAVALLYHSITSEECLADISSSMEDVLVAQCLLQSDVHIVYDTRSQYDGLQIFHPQSPNASYHANASWYVRMAANYSQGEDCCSSYSASFQDIRGGEKYMTCLHEAIYSNALH
jgi:glycoprotein-N-acetylgalactosamine 3-beta-galactosyltransferase